MPGKMRLGWNKQSSSFEEEREKALIYERN
jgi:hypothetical protein